jgi:hypothetical protein
MLNLPEAMRASSTGLPREPEAYSRSQRPSSSIVRGNQTDADLDDVLVCHWEVQSCESSGKNLDGLSGAFAEYERPFIRPAPL